MLTNAIKFMREVKAEGSKITWPSLKDTRMMTLTVFVFVTIIMAYLLLADWLIGLVMRWLLGTN